jgi:hypothetical protein
MSATIGISTGSTRKRWREDCHAVVIPPAGSWNPPPLPSSSSSTTLTDNTLGQRLLHLLRALDKHDKDQFHHPRNDDDDKNDEQSLSYLSTLSETLHLFQQLTDQVSRRGLLQGNAALAERVLLLAASSALDSGMGGGGGGRSSHKRKHKSGRNNANKNNNELTMMDDCVPTVLDDLATKGANATTTTTTSTLDVQLVLVAVSRVLEASGSGTSSPSALDTDRRWIVVAAAANLVTAASRYLTQSMTRYGPQAVSETDACFLAEYELVARPGKSLLSGLHQHVTALLWDGHHPSKPTVNDQEEAQYAMVACLRAAASLVTLFGTRLSRSTAVLANWYGTASTVLTANLGTLAHRPAADAAAAAAAATALLVALVGTSTTAAATTTTASAVGTLGLTDSSSRLSGAAAAAAWNRAVGQAVSAAGAAISRVAPVVTMATNKELLVSWPTASSQSSDDATNWVGTMSEKLLSQIQESTRESTKVDLFLQLLDRLVGYLVALFLHSSALANSTGAAISVDAILSLIETMLAFSMACEAKYHGTKKRLRHEAIENGWLSPMALVSHVALHVRRHGHVLLDAILSLLSPGGSLLPYARRVWKLAADALWSSSSAALRGVLDPATSLHGKWPRWLHTSVAARVAAVQSLRRTVQAFGIVPTQTWNASGTSSHGGSRNRHHHAVERAITLICGTLMEAWSSGRETVSVDWGSLPERVSLCAACASCLAAALSCGGEFLSSTVRELVDSVATASLEAVQHGHALVTSGGGRVQASILNLGAAIVVTPWPDGAASASSLVVQTVARASLQSGHTDVVVAATSALQVCAALSCPRVPALHVVTRAPSDESAQRGTPRIVTASDMAAQLEASRAEIERVKAAAAATAQEQALAASSKRSQSSKAAKTNNAAIKDQETGAASASEILPEQENSDLSPTRLPGRDNDLTMPTNATTGTEISERGDVSLEIVLGKGDDHPTDEPMPDAQADGDNGDFDFPPIVDCPPDEDDV